MIVETTTTKRFCDLCKKEITIDGFYGLVNVDYSLYKNLSYYENRHSELCKECATKIGKVIEECMKGEQVETPKRPNWHLNKPLKIKDKNEIDKFINTTERQGTTEQEVFNYVNKTILKDKFNFWDIVLLTTNKFKLPKATAAAYVGKFYE